MITVNSAFDSGAIDIIDVSDPLNIRLNIRRDLASEFRQWFCFRVTGKCSQKYVIRLCNHGDTSYKDGFNDYNAFVSTDYENWERVPCHIDGSNFCITYTSPTSFFYISYFEPYTWERHIRLLSVANKSGIAQIETWGVSKEGRPIDAVVINSSLNMQRKVWLIARQHPGETMAEFFMEGFIHRLLDTTDKVSSELRKLCSFYMVPNMNPDGSVHGNLRTNCSGKNLNREWTNPSADGSPEVLYVRNQMHEIGVDCFFDVHGDESIPYVFTDPCLDNSVGKNDVERMSNDEHHLLSMIEKHCRNFQYKTGYEHSHYTEEEILSMARGYVSKVFSCPSITIEMPFKDHTPNKNPKTGWNGCRSIELGKEWVDGLLAYFKVG
ncbi:MULTISPECIES: M14 family metallopeptidase [Candidatus Ichthyocystis]|uniref:M14 family metallopeptidase n=1 Tax=Candidatus Ichthyocystis TaxID=2929841 RepID=UPI000B832741|nr:MULTISPECIES: M14-type cytosolic carboxypeptidase [Ichthyocystis]